MIFTALINTFFSNLLAPLLLLPDADAGILSSINSNIGTFFGWLVPFNEFFPANTFVAALLFLLAAELTLFSINLVIRLIRGA
jgi:hypothetical protein